MMDFDIHNVVVSIHQKDFYGYGVKFMRWNPDRFLVELILKSTCKKSEEFFANLLGEKIDVPSVFVTETIVPENDNSKFALDHVKVSCLTRSFNYDFNLILSSKNIQGFNHMLLLMHDGSYILAEKIKNENSYASWRISKGTAELFSNIVQNYNGGNYENYNNLIKKLSSPEIFKIHWYKILGTEQLTNLLN